MLTALHIKNIVLIEQLSLEFSEGLSALTGETGAGKSILLDSLGLVAGARADAGLVRRGEDQASVVAEFYFPEDHPIFALLEEQGIEKSQNELSLRRVLGSDGRSKAFVNNEPVSVSFLKTIGEMAVDIHGQFETYGLLNPATHRFVLDCYAGNSSLLSEVSSCYLRYKTALENVQSLEADAALAVQNEAYLRECVDELEALDPQEGEEEELVARKKAIQNVEALQECFSFVQEALGGEQGADLQIGQAARKLERHADKIGEGDVNELVAILDRASSEVQEACRYLDGLVARYDLEGMDLEQIEDRLYSLRALARKHHCSVEALPSLCSDLKEKILLIDECTDALAHARAETAECKDKYISCAKRLHVSRKKAGQRLDKIVNSELKPLKLDKSVFETSVEVCHPENAWGVQGFDEVRFLVATNASSDSAPHLEPLNKIASGGEMARFMLALKVVLADSTPYSGSFVFDEIDTGIGGATANAVGERLAKMAMRHQVLVVTHSPQVAALAHHHWKVSKSAGRTTITPLAGETRQEEIARMLSGAEVSAEARAAAAKLLDTG